MYPNSSASYPVDVDAHENTPVKYLENHGGCPTGRLLRMTGVLPAELGNMAKLVGLELGGNFITGDAVFVCWMMLRMQVDTRFLLCCSLYSESIRQWLKGLYHTTTS